MIISINIDYCLFNGFVLDLFYAQNLDQNFPMIGLELFRPHTVPIQWRVTLENSQSLIY